MFLKPFTTKSKTIIKSTECKKLRSNLQSQYSSIDEIILDAIVPLKSEIVLAKLLLHNGSISNVYLYQNQPLVFTYNDILFFTVYSLWKCKPILPYLKTWPTVFEKLLNGADLMLPGVILNESSKQFNANQPCAVCLKGNSSAVSVGTMAMSSQDIYERRVDKGKAVLILHSYKDFLWSLGDKSVLPQTNYQFYGIVDPKDSQSELSDIIEPKDSQSVEICINVHADLDLESNNTLDTADDLRQVDGDVLNSLSTQCDIITDDSILKFDSMDILIDQILLYTLKKQKNKLTLPILTSTFYRNFLIENCPIGNFLDIKQTSYKKLSKYLSCKQKEGFLKVEELSKGVDSITSFNYDHQKISEFRIQNWESKKVENEIEGKANASSFYPPIISEVFIISAKTQEFFKTFGKRKGDALTAQDIRQFITEYIKSNSLQVGSVIKLDALLTDIVVGRIESLETLEWPQLLQRFQDQLGCAYYMSVDQQPAILHKGCVPKIILDVEQRASNKKVTTIQNMKQFMIDEEKFAQTIQRLVSGSASVTTDRSNIRKVVVQGNQIHHIKTLLLDTYQIPVKYIVGLEKAIKNKK